MNNDRIRICKVFNFEMAHALLNYDGLCRNIHGHSYKLYVTVEGYPLQQKNHPNDGMVMDFKLLKKIVKDNITEPLDHALALNDQTPDEIIDSLQKGYQKIIVKPFQPTCENLLLEMAESLSSVLPEGVQLVKLKLWETATSYAEWTNNNRS